MASYRIEELLGELTPVEKKFAPETLYVAGDVEVVRRSPKVAVVGSRRASEAGRTDATWIAETLARLGTTVVSGLAEGIDTAAHQGALASSGKTFAIIGTGLDRAYPVRNRALQARLVRDFAVLSQFPEGSVVKQHNFPMRNRTMAMLSDATVIVEAGRTSGTINQGWEALRLGRTLLISERVAMARDLPWPKQMLAYGAQVLWFDHLDEQLAEVPPVTVVGEPAF